MAKDAPLVVVVITDVLLTFVVVAVDVFVEVFVTKVVLEVTGVTVELAFEEVVAISVEVVELTLVVELTTLEVTNPLPPSTF